MATMPSIRLTGYAHISSIYGLQLCMGYVLNKITEGRNVTTACCFPLVPGMDNDHSAGSMLMNHNPKARHRLTH